MLTANATIAQLKALPATSPNLDGGGNDGAGKLHTTPHSVVSFITIIQ